MRRQANHMFDPVWDVFQKLSNLMGSWGYSLPCLGNHLSLDKSGAIMCNVGNDTNPDASLFPNVS